jgi:hypothetical protein
MRGAVAKHDHVPGHLGDRRRGEVAKVRREPDRADLARRLRAVEAGADLLGETLARADPEDLKKTSIVSRRSRRSAVSMSFSIEGASPWKVPAITRALRARLERRKRLSVR